jgi:hypothetical protein
VGAVAWAARARARPREVVRLMLWKQRLPNDLRSWEAPWATWSLVVGCFCLLPRTRAGVPSVARAHGRGGEASMNSNVPVAQNGAGVGAFGSVLSCLPIEHRCERSAMGSERAGCCARPVVASADHVHALLKETPRSSH